MSPSSMHHIDPYVSPGITRRYMAVLSGRTTQTELTPCAWLTHACGTTTRGRTGPTLASTRANCPGLSERSGLGNITTSTSVPVVLDTSLRV